MKDIERFAWAIAVIIALGIGSYAGRLVTTEYKDREIVQIQHSLDEATDELADAVKERDFWRWALKGLAEGGQFEGVDLKGRPSETE